MLSILLAFAMVYVSAAIQYSGPCYVMPQPVHNSQRNNSVEIPPKCKTGTVGWDFPQGVARVHLVDAGKSFNLCLLDSSLTNMAALHVTTAGTYVQVPVPTEGHPACTESVEGEAEFLVSASKLQMYFTYIDYSVAFNTIQ